MAYAKREEIIAENEQLKAQIGALEAAANEWQKVIKKLRKKLKRTQDDLAGTEQMHQRCCDSNEAAFDANAKLERDLATALEEIETLKLRIAWDQIQTDAAVAARDSHIGSLNDSLTQLFDSDFTIEL